MTAPIELTPEDVAAIERIAVGLDGRPFVEAIASHFIGVGAARQTEALTPYLSHHAGCLQGLAGNATCSCGLSAIRAAKGPCEVTPQEDAMLNRALFRSAKRVPHP